MENKVITVAIYIRVSTEEQVKHGYSLDAQKENLINYCKAKKYKIYDFYIDEGKSARSKLRSRTQMLRLIDDVQLKKINRIVFIKLDRWFRSIADYYKVQEILDKYKVDWEATQEEYNTTTSSGRLNLNIRLSIAQDEADRTGDRIRFTFANMVQNKRPIQGTNCMPLGYMVAGEGKEKRVVKNQATAHIVDDMFEYFKNYNSIRKTLLYINNKYNLTINYHSMRNYLKNKLYCGIYRGVVDYCEPYISLEEFEKHQYLIKKNVKNNKKHDYLFSGLIKCRCCHYNMAGFKTSSTKPKYNKKYSYYAYRCNKSYNSHLCENRSPIIESKLENFLLTTIQDEAKKYIITEEQSMINESKSVVNVDKLRSKLDRLAELYIDNKITKEKYNESFDKITAEIQEASSKKEKKINLTNLKNLANEDLLLIYNKLANNSKRSFWASYIDYIERDENLNFIVHFKK